LVGANDIATQALWTRNFLEAQGYKSETTIYQDNTSAMLLENKGTESSSKRTRHINIRYYFIKDCIDKQQLSVKYCPTDDMIGDFPSKPLQGKKFKKHRMAIMNEKGEKAIQIGQCHNHDSSLDNRSVLARENSNFNSNANLNNNISPG